MIKQKVLAYITHANRLLVFRHVDFPEAGIQVPAGTIEPGEAPADAALREATEESGLQDLQLVAFLGEEVRDLSEFGLEQIHKRYFYHLSCPGNPPESWRHYENNPSEGPPDPILLEFFWVALPNGVPPLAGVQDSLLTVLFQRMGLLKARVARVG
jgi:ADP-ribose pyrophosphatase YjhB (NUDIX family)